MLPRSNLETAISSGNAVAYQPYRSVEEYGPGQSNSNATLTLRPSGAEFTENQEERCPILLCLDTSQSMQGTPILEMNQAIAVQAGPPSTTTTRLRWWLHPAFTAGGAASLVGAARPLVA